MIENNGENEESGIVEGPFEPDYSLGGRIGNADTFGPDAETAAEAQSIANSQNSAWAAEQEAASSNYDPDAGEYGSRPNGGESDGSESSGACDWGSDV